MTTILRAVDTDLTTVRLDLNALASGSTGFGYFQLDLGSVDPDVDWLAQKPYPGASKAQENDPLVSGSVRLYAKHTSYDNLLALARSLDTELQRESIWEFRPDGASESIFILIPTFSRPSLFRGGNLVQVIRQFQDPEGLPVSFLRQPGFIQAPTVLATGTVTNEVDSRHISYSHSGNLPSPVKIEAAISSSGAETAAMRIFRKVFPTDAARDEFEGHYSTLATSLSATYGSNTATSGSIARTTFASTGYFLPRLKWVITPTLKESLTGSYRVMMVGEVSDGTKVSMKVLWGNRDVDPLDNQTDPVTIDFNTTDVTTSVKFEKELGTVHFDEDGSALVIEFHAQCDTSNGATDTLDWAQFYLAPVGQAVMAHSPGLMNAGRVQDRWTGDEFGTPSNPGSLTAGAVDEKTIVLNADTEAAGTKPNTGTALPVAWHVYELEATLYRPGSSSSTSLGEFRIRNITDSSTVATKILNTKGSREWTTLTKTIRFLSVSAKLYQPQIVGDASLTGGAKIVVKRLTHSSIPIVNNDAKFVLDGIENEAEIQTSSSIRTSELKLREGGYPVVPTGYVIDIFSLGDVAPLGYDDASDSPLLRVVEAREADVTYTVQERVSH